MENKPHNTCTICGSSLSLAYAGMYDDRYGYPKSFDVLHCSSCGTFSTEPPLKPEEIGPLYSGYYPLQSIDLKSVEMRGNKKDTPSQRFMHWWHGNHKIQHMLPANGSGKKVLDIGCGDGASLIELRNHGYEAFGIETNKDVAAARDAFGLDIHIGTVEDCHFPEHSFDYVMANQVIEHIVDLDSFIVNAKRFLAPGGVLILSTPNAASVYRKIFGRKWAHWHIPYHQHIMTAKAISILLKKHGFEVASKKTVSPTTWMIHTLNRMRFTPKQGEKNPLWSYTKASEDSDAPESADSNASNASKAFKPKRIAYSLVVNLISLTNRIIDIFNAGDCVVISAELKRPS